MSKHPTLFAQIKQHIALLEIDAVSIQFSNMLPLSCNMLIKFAGKEKQISTTSKN